MGTMRDLTIETTTELDPASAWADVIAGRDLRQATAAEFDLAEETIALLEFTDGTYEVGVGECLRPYCQVYAGADRDQAGEEFWRLVRGHADAWEGCWS
jgi:hypothetical protein